MKADLRRVTLICADAINPERASKALNACLTRCDFASAKLFTNGRPSKVADAVSVIQIGPLTREGYSGFIIEKLIQFVDTDFCLIVQYDGFVINAGAWDSGFLTYDYIGAPWAWCYGHMVGNGGFSLRSRRFLESSSRIRHDSSTPEDVFLLREKRNDLERAGIEVAPFEVAVRFSTEQPIPGMSFAPTRTFGFHNRWAMRYFRANSIDPWSWQPGIAGSSGQ